MWVWFCSFHFSVYFIPSHCFVWRKDWGQATNTTLREHFSMGNCFSEVTAGRAAIGGTAGDFRSLAGAPNDAVENFLRSRGHHGLFSQIEVLSLLLIEFVSVFCSRSLLTRFQLWKSFYITITSCCAVVVVFSFWLGWSWCAFQGSFPSVKRLVNLNLLHPILPI